MSDSITPEERAAQRKVLADKFERAEKRATTVSGILFIPGAILLVVGFLSTFVVGTWALIYFFLPAGIWLAFCVGIFYFMIKSAEKRLEEFDKEHK